MGRAQDKYRNHVSEIAFLTILQTPLDLPFRKTNALQSVEPIF
jgi:hypothetical protein